MFMYIMTVEKILILFKTLEINVLLKLCVLASQTNFYYVFRILFDPKNI